MVKNLIYIYIGRVSQKDVFIKQGKIIDLKSQQLKDC